MRESASASTCTSTPPHAHATVRILSRARRCRDLRPSSCSFVRQIQEVYSWARCAPPLPAAAMRALGAPLPAAQLADAQQPLAWADFQVRDFLFTAGSVLLTCWQRSACQPRYSSPRELSACSWCAFIAGSSHSWQRADVYVDEAAPPGVQKYR